MCHKYTAIRIRYYIQVGYVLELSYCKNNTCSHIIQFQCKRQACIYSQDNTNISTILWKGKADTTAIKNYYVLQIIL